MFLLPTKKREPTSHLLHVKFWPPIWQVWLSSLMHVYKAKDQKDDLCINHRCFKKYFFLLDIIDGWKQLNR